MAQIFYESEIDPNLPGIIIASHGALAVASLETLRMLTGEQTNLAAFSLEEGESSEDFMKKIGTAVEAFPEGSIVFADIKGGTPFNTIMMYAKKTRKVLYAIAGFNVPMLVQAVMERTIYSGEELFESLLDIENNGVFNMTEFLEAHMESTAEKEEK